MPVFDRLKHGMDLTRFKADQLLRMNRVQGDIDSLNHDVSQVRRKLAGKAIELHQAGHLADPELEQICLEIDEISRRIGQKEAEIASIRAEEAPQYTPPVPNWVENPCPHCGFGLPAGATFCPNCGGQLAAPVQESAPTVACANCGFGVEAGAEFCPECGRKMTLTDAENSIEEG